MKKMSKFDEFFISCALGLFAIIMIWALSIQVAREFRSIKKRKNNQEEVR